MASALSNSPSTRSKGVLPSCGAGGEGTRWIGDWHHKQLPRFAETRTAAQECPQRRFGATIALVWSAPQPSHPGPPNPPSRHLAHAHPHPHHRSSRSAGLRIWHTGWGWAPRGCAHRPSPQRQRHTSEAPPPHPNTLPLPQCAAGSIRTATGHTEGGMNRGGVLV